jgi:hypothetical protein
MARSVCYLYPPQKSESNFIVFWLNPTWTTAPGYMHPKKLDPFTIKLLNPPPPKITILSPKKNIKPALFLLSNTKQVIERMAQNNL